MRVRSRTRIRTDLPAASRVREMPSSGEAPSEMLPMELTATFNIGMDASAILKAYLPPVGFSIGLDIESNVHISLPIRMAPLQLGLGMDLAAPGIRLGKIFPAKSLSVGANLNSILTIQQTVNPLIVAVANTGTSQRVMTSPDGINWTMQTTPNKPLTCVAFAPDLVRFVALSSDGTGTYSNNGTGWNNTTLPGSGWAWQSVCYSEALGLFAAVHNTAGTTTHVATSPDGINWTARTTPDQSWLGITWSDALGLFIATSTNGTGSRVMTSPDGITWTARTSPDDRSWRRVAAGASAVAAIANDGVTDGIMSSADAITWAKQSTASAKNWLALCYADDLGLFIAVASSAGGTLNVATSPDGTTWTLRNSAANQTWRQVCWSPELELLIAVSSSGTGTRVQTSPDGTNWTLRSTPADLGFQDIAAGYTLP